MEKMYRINYVVGIDKAICTIYTYPILDEKKTYFLIRSGRFNRQIKKDNIGVIRSIDVNETGHYVFLTGLEDKDIYIDKMIEKIKDNAQKQIRKFESVYSNAIVCGVEVVEVEPE